LDEDMEKRIMIVDDDPDILITFRQIFEHEGYKVFTVDSGKDCIKEIENGFKGLVLVDLMLPFMDGWQTIQEIIKRDLGKNVKIFIITAKGTLEQEKINEVGPYIFDYIKKPIDIEELLLKVKKMSFF